MSDIVPALLEAIESDFTKRLEQDTMLSDLGKIIGSGQATFEEASDYAKRLGEILSGVLEEHISADMLPDGRMYYNIAERILRPMLSNNYELAADAAAQVQQSLNRAAGLGLKAIKPAPDMDRITGIIDKVSEAESFERVSWMLAEPVTNLTMSAVEDTIRENVDFHGRAGLKPTIKRVSAGSCCEWCSEIEGEYKYPVDREVYRRHEYCRCHVFYDPGDGRVQDAHSKRVYESQAEAERDARVARAKELEQNQWKRPDIIASRSVGAKAADVFVRLPNGEEVKRTPGTGITSVELIAGRGRNRKIDEVDILLSRYEGTSEGLWQKYKGVGYVDYHGESYRANLHWYEEPSVGRVEFKLKPDAAGNWFYED